MTASPPELTPSPSGLRPLPEGAGKVLTRGAGDGPPAVGDEALAVTGDGVLPEGDEVLPEGGEVLPEGGEVLPEGTGDQASAVGTGGRSLSLRLATWAHLGTLAGSVGFWAYMDRHIWFFGDEWQFLLGRGLGYAPGARRGIWFPHNEHWSTLPILLWRGLYSVFHLSTYWPYLIPVLLAQAGVMHLGWRLCRREGADPWVATAAVGVLGFLGAGAEDLVWGFQIGFVGSVFFGLLAFDLLERRPATRREGRTASANPLVGGNWVAPWSRSVGGGRAAPWSRSVLGSRLVGGSNAAARRRLDNLASLALLASLMCSTVGDAMVAGGALLTFARRSRRDALRILALPVGSWVIWFAFIGRLGLHSSADQVTSATITGLPAYVWTGLSSALGQTFNLEAAGAAILVGLAAWLAWHSQRLWLKHPSALALSVAATVFYVLAALGRDALGDSQAVPRYVYIALALLLPVLAMVLSSLGPGLAPKLLAVGLLVVTALGNIGQAQTYVSTRDRLVEGLKIDTEAAASLLAAGTQDVAGPQARPITLEPNITAAALVGLERSHLLPPATLTPVDLANARTLLSVSLTRAPLSNGRLSLLGNSYSLATPTGKGCVVFSPQTVGQPVQIWLQLLPHDASASVHVQAAPALPGLTNYVAAVIAPYRGPPATNPAQLSMPPSGSAYLSYNDRAAKLVIMWTSGAPLTLCGLAPSAAQRP